MTWTQPLCFICWAAYSLGKDGYVHEPRRVRVDEGEEDYITETCCNCGSETVSGIYTRLNPNYVAFPRKDDDETAS